MAANDDILQIPPSTSTVLLINLALTNRNSIYGARNSLLLLTIFIQILQVIFLVIWLKSSFVSSYRPECELKPPGSKSGQVFEHCSPYGASCQTYLLLHVIVASQRQTWLCGLRVRDWIWGVCPHDGRRFPFLSLLPASVSQKHFVTSKIASENRRGETRSPVISSVSLVWHKWQG